MNLYKIVVFDGFGKWAQYYMADRLLAAYREFQKDDYMFISIQRLPVKYVNDDAFMQEYQARDMTARWRF